MTFEQFKYYLDAYGASFRRWPEDVRAAAESFLAADHAAAAALAEARRLDALLERYAPKRDVEAEAHLVARIAAQAATADARPWGGFTVGFGSLRSRAAVLAVMALLGIVTGIIQVNQTSAEQQTAWSDVTQTSADDAPFSVAGL
jgi:anti-sigma factor RsiW